MMTRFFLIILSITSFLYSQSEVYASGSVSSFQYSKSLRTLLEIDRSPSSDLEDLRRIRILDTLDHSLSVVNLWNQKPTFDMTLTYVPYLQKYSLSCEIAALHMVLRRSGVTESEDALIARLPFSLEAYTGGVWGDPDEAFVGSITGSQSQMTGYGVYPGPLAKMLSGSYRTEVFSLVGDTGDTEQAAKAKLTNYLSRIENGAQVILWGDWCTRPAYEDGILNLSHRKILRFFPLSGYNRCKTSITGKPISWKTPQGKLISGISGEHVFVLLGYLGSRDAPTHIIVWDTDTGRHIYARDEWMRKWSLLEYRALLIDIAR